MGTRKLVCVCDACGTELDMKFHEGTDGELVLSVAACERCLEEEFEKGYRDGCEDCDEKYYLRRLHLRLQKE